MKKEENIGEAATPEMPSPGNPPAILEIVEYIKYYASKKKSRAEIKKLLSKNYTFQEIEVSLNFYEVFVV